MKVINLSQTHSLLNKFVAELRDVTVQKDRLRFRRNIERVGEIMAYEISKTFTYKAIDVHTPLGIAQEHLPTNPIVVATILRAGLPFHQGFVNYIDASENAFVSAYRKYKDRLNFDVHIEYIASPSVQNKTLIITDPMLATGSSMELGYKALITKGKPAQIHIASVIASKPALDYLEKVLPADSTVWLAALDQEIDEHSYIIPGLGDAGDLAFGPKLD